MANYAVPYSGEQITEYLAKARDFAGVPIGDGIYSAGKTYTALNQYLVDNGGLYKVKDSVTLPYAVNVALYPSASSDPSLLPYENFELDQLAVVARSLNVTGSQVIYATDITTPLDNILYIYDGVAEVTYNKPVTATTIGEKIISLVGTLLTTTVTTYVLNKTEVYIVNPNMLQNSHFRQPSPDPLITPPSATPEAYNAGDQVFLNYFVSAGGATLTQDPVTKLVSVTAGSIYQDVPKSGPLGEYTGALVASWGNSEGQPTEDGAVISIDDTNPDYYRVTLTPNGCFSAKMEQGVVASRHEAASKIDRNKTQTFKTVFEMKDGGAVSGSDIDLGDLPAKTTGYTGGLSAAGVPIGGGEYTLTTLQKVRDSKANPAWVPDGFGDHYLFNGVTYVAMLNGPTYYAEQFGCREGNDDAVPLQAFFDYSENKEVETSFGIGEFIWDGTYLTSQPLFLRKNKFTHYVGLIIATSAMETILTISDATVGTQFKNLLGTRGSSNTNVFYENRLVTNGVVIDDGSLGCIFDGFDSRELKGRGLICGANGSNTINANLGEINSQNVGSAIMDIRFGLEFDFQSRVDTGAATGQISTLQCLNLPEEIQVSELLSINGEVYQVYGRSGDQLEIFPHISDLSFTSGTIQSMHGGAVITRTGDSTCIKMTSVRCLRVGVGFTGHGNQGPSLGNLLVEASSVAMAIGASGNSNMIGLSVDGFHCEGTAFHIVRSTRVSCGVFMAGNHALDLSLCTGIGYRKSDTKRNEIDVSLRGFTLVNPAETLSISNGINASSTNIQGGNRPEQSNRMAINTVNQQVSLRFQEDQYRLFGYATCVLEQVAKTAGVASVPQVEYSINSADATKGYTINGSSSPVVIPSAAVFGRTIKAVFIPDNLDWVVY